jgi:hypothetical protein
MRILLKSNSEENQATQIKKVSLTKNYNKNIKNKFDYLYFIFSFYKY